MYKIVSTLFSANIISAFFPILFTPVLARLYSPKLFGEFSIFLSSVLILSSLLSLRFENIILLSSRGNKLKKNFSSIIVGVLIFSFVFIVVGGVVASVFLGVGREFFLFSFTSLLSTLNNLMLSLCLRFSIFKYVAVYKVLFSLLTVAFQLLFAYLFSFFQNGLIFGYFSGVLVLFGFSLIFLRQLIFLYFSIFYFDFKVFKEKGRYLFYSNLSLIVNNLARYSPVFIIGKFYGFENLGFYQMAMRVVNAPTTIISQAVSEYLKSRIREGVTRRFVFEVFLGFLMLFLISVVIFIAIYFFSIEIVPVFLGYEWEGAVSTFKVLSFIVFFQMLGNPSSVLLMLLNKYRLDFFIQMGMMFFLIIPFFVEWDYLDYLFYYSFIMSIVYLSFFFSLVLCLYEKRRKY